MRLFLVTLILLITVSSAGYKKKKSKSDRKYRKSSPTTSSPTTPSPTTPSPTTIDLCSCFDIDLLSDPVESNGEICYSYRINRISDADACLDAIDYIAIDVDIDDLDECDLDLTDIDGIVTKYSGGKCNSIDTDYSSTNVNGIKIKFDKDGNDYSSGSGYKKKKSKKGDDDRRRRLRTRRRLQSRRR